MKIGVIGSGGIAARHLAVLEAMPEVEVAGHVTKSLEHARQAAARWGGRAYSSHRDLLTGEALDAVWICVPPHEHGDIEETLVAARIPFFVEKPLDADCRTAERVAHRITESELPVAVGYHWRALDTLREVRTLLRERPAQLVIGTWLSSTPPPTWWHRQSQGGGQLVEQATHLVDLARYLIGEAEPVACITSHTERAAFPDLDVSTVTTALLRFRTGTAGSFCMSPLLDGTTDVSLRLVSEGRLITISAEKTIVSEHGGLREIARSLDPFEVEDRAFIAAVEANDPTRVLCDYADALRTHRLCCALREMAA